MTRFITYPNQLAGSLTQMEMQVESMIEQSLIIQAILGDGISASPTNTMPLFIGFATVPNDPASLVINVNGGTIFSWQVVDATAFGQMPSQIPQDTTDSISKIAYTFESTPFTITPPGTPGFSRNDLIEVGFLEQDGNTQAIPFYNGFTVGGGFGIPIYQDLPTQRIDSPVIQIKLGTAAATGTQTTPTPDAGFAGAYFVTTANGQTTITSGNITQYDGGSLIAETLTQKLSENTANGIYETIANFNIYVDTTAPATYETIANATTIADNLNTFIVTIAPETYETIANANSTFETVSNFAAFVSRFSQGAGSFTIPTSNPSVNVIVNFGNTNVVGAPISGPPVPVTVTYATPFPNGVMFALATQNGDFENTATIEPISNSTANLRSIGASTGTNDIWWMAVGN